MNSPYKFNWTAHLIMTGVLLAFVAIGYSLGYKDGIHQARAECLGFPNGFPHDN